MHDLKEGRILKGRREIEGPLIKESEKACLGLPFQRS